MPSAVVLDGVTKSFGERRAVDDLSLEVEAGQVFGFLGPNGAGKSTTIRMMLGLYRPTAGSCRVLGMDPVAQPVALLRRVGYLPGELALFPRLTGGELLDRFARARDLRDRGLGDELVRRFDVDLRRPVRLLSKGNRQKIGLVLAFMHRPDLLVLDEPTSGLDPLLQDEFAGLLREAVAAGATVFLSSHDLDEVQRVVDRLAIIRAGRIVVSDTVEGLRAMAPRTLELRLEDGVDPAPLAALPGVQLRSVDGGRVVLAVTGPIAPVLSVVARMSPLDLVARPADLDELFLQYYGPDRAEEHQHVG